MIENTKCTSNCTHIFQTNQVWTRLCCCLVTRLCLTLIIPWTAEDQASLSLTISWSLPKFMFIELLMPSNHPHSANTPWTICLISILAVYDCAGLQIQIQNPCLKLHSRIQSFKFKKSHKVTSLVQWLRLPAFIAGGVGSVPGQRTKILHAAQHGPKLKQNSHKMCILYYAWHPSRLQPIIPYKLSSVYIKITNKD